MNLPKQIANILSALNKSGFKAYVVGGAVRDFLLSAPCSDYDLATSAVPAEIIKALYPIKVIDSGGSNGTVTALTEIGNVEITPFRKESGYTDRRHPDSVRFCKSLSDDLSRRDFTVNALAFSPCEGIIDLFGGKKDIEDRLIRCVGDADACLSQDALRVLRALRFSACLGFEIEEKTSAAIKRKVSLLSFISKERIFGEIKQLINGKNAARVLSQYGKIFADIFSLSPAVFENDGGKSLWELCCDSLNTLPESTAVRLAAILRLGSPCSAEKSCRENLCSSAEKAAKTLKKLRADNKTVLHVKQLISCLSLSSIKTRADIEFLCLDFPSLNFEEVLLLCSSDDPRLRTASKKHFSDVREMYRTIVEGGGCRTLSSLEITGGDLKALGLNGKQIRRVLEKELRLVITGELENRREALLSFALESPSIH